MATPEEARRAFETMRAMARKKKLKEFWVAVIFGVICSIFITLIILLLNLKRVF